MMMVTTEGKESSNGKSQEPRGGHLTLEVMINDVKKNRILPLVSLLLYRHRVMY